MFRVLWFALGLLSCDVCFSANSLSDQELALVGGGGIDANLNGETQLQLENQEPPASKLPTAQSSEVTNGMDAAPELFAVLQSRIEETRERRVALDGAAQKNSVAINLENTVASDTVATSNIFNGVDIAAEEIRSKIEVNQGNDIVQRHRKQGSLSSSGTEYRFEITVESHSGFESYNHQSYSSIYRQRESLLQRNSAYFSSAHVGSRSISLEEIFKNVLPIQFVNNNPISSRIFGFPATGAILDAEWFGEYGATLEYTGVQLTSIGLALESIQVGGVDNMDLLIGASVTLPQLDFGGFEIEWCPSVCDRYSLDLGSIGGDVIYPEYVLSGLAPRVDEVNSGVGFDVSGAGFITTNPGGRLVIDGDIDFSVTSYAKLTLDLSELTLLSVVNVGNVIKQFNTFGNGSAKISDTLGYEFVDAHIPFEILNENFGIATEHFDNIPSIIFSSELSEEVDEYIELSSLVDVAENSFSSSYEHSVLIGGNMTGAEAELLALSDSSLSLTSNNTVSLSEETQKNMRLLNGVNATASVAANALNVGKLPARVTAAPRSLRVSTQQNTFLQHR